MKTKDVILDLQNRLDRLEKIKVSPHKISELEFGVNHPPIYRVGESVLHLSTMNTMVSSGDTGIITDTWIGQNPKTFGICRWYGLVISSLGKNIMFIIYRQVVFWGHNIFT